ncbi:hypothetical protein [Singulisphaera sp. PoT]|uniref:hypothetical protein n=1 Tax=Singulisphaera sp. PoT TaxID=3411797 RepID=UPI003BF52CF4
MHPTLRPAMAMLNRLFRGLGLDPQGNKARRGRRRLEPQLAPLESRQLLYFSPAVATAVPSTLWPPNGGYVPVVVSGTFREFALVNDKPVFTLLPGPKQASFNVVDEYHKDEPSGPIHLKNEGGGVFSYSFTINLQASRSEQFAAGRRYYINVAAKDNDGWSGKTLVVQVPLSLKDRGPGPVVVTPRMLAQRAAGAHGKH